MQLRYVNVEETQIVVVDEDGNVLSTELGGASYEPEPSIYTEVVYMEAEPETVYVEAEPEVHTVVVEDIAAAAETVTVEVPETETVTVVENVTE